MADWLMNRSLPVYTRVLTPRDYGVMEMLAYTTDVLTFLVGLGVSTAVTRHYYKYETEAERHALVSTAAVLLFVLFAVGVAAKARRARRSATPVVGHLLSTPISPI